MGEGTKGDSLAVARGKALAAVLIAAIVLALGGCGFAHALSSESEVGSGAVEEYAEGLESGLIVADDDLYPDVTDSSQWYYKSVYYLQELGLMTGYADGDLAGYFGVGYTLARQEFVTMLWRYSCPDEYAAYTDEVEAAAAGTDAIEGVEDGQYFTAAANWAVEEGVITGVERDGSYYFDGESPITFEEMATMMARLLSGDDVDTDAYDAGALLASTTITDAASVDEWALGNVAWCVDNGLFTGYANEDENGEPDGTYTLEPTEQIKRERAATIVYNAYQAGLMDAGSGSSTTTHEHGWVAVTTTVHHDATYETVHHDAVTERYLYVQCTCGATFETESEYNAHNQEMYESTGIYSHAYRIEEATRTITEAYDEQVLVDAYDETVTTGYKCSVCGATHTCNWVDVTEQQWVSNNVWVQDTLAYYEQVYVGIYAWCPSCDWSILDVDMQVVEDAAWEHKQESLIEADKKWAALHGQDWDDVLENGLIVGSDLDVYRSFVNENACSANWIYRDEYETVYREATGHYEDQGYYTTVATGCKCSVCGATRSA